MSNVRLCGLKSSIFRRKSSVYGSMRSSSTPRKSSKTNNNNMKGDSMEWSFLGMDQLVLMMKVHKKIFVFRDIMKLVPLPTSASLSEMVTTTLEDLQRLYPEIIPIKKVSNVKDKSIDQGLAYFCEALKCLGESWLMNSDVIDKNIPSCKDNTNMQQLGETMLVTLDCLIKIASEKLVMMEEEERPRKFFKSSKSSSPLTPKSVIPQDSLAKSSSCNSTLWSLRIQSVGKLSPIDLKRLSYHMSPEQVFITQDKENDQEVENPKNDTTQNVKDHVLELNETMPSLSIPPPAPLLPPLPPSVPPFQQSEVAVNMQSPPPPPPPMPQALSLGLSSVALPPSIPLPPPPPMPQLSLGLSSIALPPSIPPPPPALSMKLGSAPAPPPPMPRGNGVSAAPPPPPFGAGKSLRPRATTKLKRSTQLGNLYRSLKGKVEGSSNLKGKPSGGRNTAVGAKNNGGKQGMADALAEMTKRSSYFQQIEEDVQKYTKHISEVRSTITNFKTNDMTELIKFHKDVESVLENLTDESQVLSRFEGFPLKKLEAIRMAAALYNKMDTVLKELQNVNIVTPVTQVLDKVERYFNKVKTELDALERTKDEESKKFKGHGIEFNFDILVKIKEAMVDVSSGCMELALKERCIINSSGCDGKRKECGKLLWRAFQFAFRVYTFAGGHDDRADKLTRELAMEIESDPNQVS